MDFLEDPETKKTYDKCKLIVKIWEHKFAKTHKRVPSKLDIREAPTDVRHAYRKYFQLKSAALEQSFMDIEGFENDNNQHEESSQTIESEDSLQGFVYSTSQTDSEDINTQDDNSELVEKLQEIHNTEKPESQTDKIDTDIWGSHLNKQKILKKVDQPGNTSISCITNKLFSGSKFNKRNPRKSFGKSLSFSQKTKSDNAIDVPQFLSQPVLEAKNDNNSLVSLEPATNSGVQMTAEVASLTQSNIPYSVPINPISNLEKKVVSNFRNIDNGWLQRVAHNAGVTFNFNTKQNKLNFNCDSSSNVVETKVDYSSDEVIDSSDDEQAKAAATLHVAKKLRLSRSVNNTGVTVIRDILKNNTNQNVPNRNNVAELAATENFESLDNIPHLKSHENLQTGLEKTPDESENLNDLDPIEDPSDRLSVVENAANKLSEHQPKCKAPIIKRIKKLVVHKDNSKLKGRGKKSKTTIKTLTPSGDNNAVSPRRSSRSNKVKISFEELNSSEEDPFHSDNDEKDPEFTLGKDTQTNDVSEDIEDIETPKKPIVSEKSKVNTKTKGRKVNGVNFELRANSTRKSKNQPEGKEEGPDSQKYELEYSVKPRVVASRYPNLIKVFAEKGQNKKTVVKTNNKGKDSSDISKVKSNDARDKLKEKIATGQLNENFVTINLKKKVFVKGKSKYNFSKYKKSQWKAKKKALYGPDMDMSGCDGGKLTCFNCGQEGHFAMRCPNNKGDSLLPVTVEEECAVPSLEEAHQLALDSNLSIRKPNGLVKSASDQQNNEEESDGQEENDNDDLSVFDDDIDDLLLAEAIKLDEYVKELDINRYVDNLKTVPPYFHNRTAEAPEVYEVLKQFGHTSFKRGQEKAVMRILQGKSTLVTLATGTGKSLCYQLPAYLYAKREKACITLVISPLVSLMEDQVIGIPKFLKAACLHTNQTESNRQKIIEALEANQLDVLLISPEAIVAGEKQTGFRSLFRKLPPIAFACIDEVHCISQWSHNFRPSYLMVSRVLRESLGVQTILGLTATATRATGENIIDLLGIPDGLDGIIKDTPLPDNLYLTVSKDSARDRALLDLLRSDKLKNCKSIIVYCTRRDECEKIASFLRTSFKDDAVESNGQKNKRKRFNVQAEPYHAGLSASRRRTIQNGFMSGDLRIVVATVAFGMGINKSDIRAVIHFNMPNSFESYVQEVGRAGRDGLPAFCHVFLDSLGRDESELRRHIHANSIDRHVIRKLLQKVFVPCSCKGQCPKHEVAFSIEETVRALDIPEENITTLLCYLELHKNKYIELLSPAYTTCKVIAYGGLNHIKKAAKDCPPLAVALALYHSKSENDNILEFPIVDVASAIGWESGICKHKLKNLEWTSENNVSKRSCLSVRFSNLGFRFLAPGNLPDDQLDLALDNLYTMVVNQEEKALKQLTAIHKTLFSVADKSYKDSILRMNQQEGKLTDEEENNSLEESELKTKIREYFGAVDPLANVALEPSREMNEDQLLCDVRAMVCMYRDNQFTGRAIARIFHGIQSPNYPAVIWGKCKFWRSHLHEDFHEICKIASREIIKMR